jgi:hypothetical protein
MVGFLIALAFVLGVFGVAVAMAYFIDCEADRLDGDTA